LRPYPKYRVPISHQRIKKINIHHTRLHVPRNITQTNALKFGTFRIAHDRKTKLVQTIKKKSKKIEAKMFYELFQINGTK
jgi:hypothetical protein